jgi:two-component system phosphate regulon response regulator PhoB/two-component system alkaline phosphatase synthesis response regulator PhoP
MNKKILIAEDDNFLVNAYRLKFEKSGFEVQIAFDGNQALEILNKFVPSVILLDLIMPNMDGFSVLAELKKVEKYKKIPVIITSNLGQKEDIEKAMNLGARDFFVKSDTSIAEIVAKVSSYIS